MTNQFRGQCQSYHGLVNVSSIFEALPVPSHLALADDLVVKTKLYSQVTLDRLTFD